MPVSRSAYPAILQMSFPSSCLILTSIQFAEHCKFPLSADTILREFVTFDTSPYPCAVLGPGSMPVEKLRWRWTIE
jgi:hypothetical protein